MAEEPTIKHLVRIAHTDLKGTQAVLYGLQRIKGVGNSVANAICKLAKIPANKKTGILSDQEIAVLDRIIKEPQKSGIPSWLLNRRKDYETGEDRHLITADLTFQQENDIKLLKKIKSYKGIRHMLGQPVRGQRTRGNFRKNKGKVMGVKISAGAKKGGKT